MSFSPKIAVLLADDHVVVREGLKALLEAQGDIEVVGEAGTGWEAVELARRLGPQIVVMDLAMPALNGWEATRIILKENRTVQVLMLSTYADEESIRQAMRAGAAGYLVKQSAAKDLLVAMQTVRQGNAYFSPEIARHIRELTRKAFVSGEPMKTTTESLTARERQVLVLIAGGGHNRGIGIDLG
ncbi:MAG TPA: response regulator transcription factor, partial [Bacillota bacterium]|nr:response regulator transcription factor [Bacillota bacterium]